MVEDGNGKKLQYKELAHQYNRVCEINAVLVEKNEAYKAENLELKEALTHALKFTPASELPMPRSAKIKPNRAAVLFAQIRNATAKNLDAICQIDESGEIISVTHDGTTIKVVSSPNE